MGTCCDTECSGGCGHPVCECTCSRGSCPHCGSEFDSCGDPVCGCGTHHFRLWLDRYPDDAELNRLYELGCGDATFGMQDSCAFADFARVSASWGEALSTALLALHTVGVRITGLTTG